MTERPIAEALYAACACLLIIVVTFALVGCASLDMYPREITAPGPNKVTSLKGLYRVTWIDGRIHEVREAATGKLVALHDRVCPGPDEGMLRAARDGDTFAKAKALDEAIVLLRWCET